MSQAFNHNTTPHQTKKKKKSKIGGRSRDGLRNCSPTKEDEGIGDFSLIVNYSVQFLFLSLKVRILLTALWLSSYVPPPSTVDCGSFVGCFKLVVTLLQSIVGDRARLSKLLPAL